MNRKGEAWASMQVLFALSLLEDSRRASRGETRAEKVRRHAAEDAQYGCSAIPEGPR